MAFRFTICLTCLIWLASSLPAEAGSPKPNPLRKPGSLPKVPPATTAAKAKPPVSSPALPVDEKAPQAGTKAYKLRYKFRPGETLRWEVEHRAKVRSTVQGTTQTAETLSLSIKVWKIESVDTDGNAALVYSVERVEMTQKFDGRQETRYNSDTDPTPPPGFENVAKAVGTPLAQLTLDPRGTVIKRDEHYVQAAPLPDNITLPLPENAVSTGEEWTMPADIVVTLPEGVTKKIKARQLYRLESVDDNVATLHLETQVLTPVNDPKIESQLVQSKASGTIRFDIAAGRVVAQQSDIDEHVHGFQGAGSSMHYVTRFSEKILPDARRAANYPQAPKPR